MWVAVSELPKPPGQYFRFLLLGYFEARLRWQALLFC
jgi:hypothetical protein